MFLATVGSIALARTTHTDWFRFVPATWLALLFLVGAVGGSLRWVGAAEAAVGGGLYFAALVAWILVAAPSLGYHVKPAPVTYFVVLAAVCLAPLTVGVFLGRVARRIALRPRA